MELKKARRKIMRSFEHFRIAITANDTHRAVAYASEISERLTLIVARSPRSHERETARWLLNMLQDCRFSEFHAAATRDSIATKDWS